MLARAGSSKRAPKNPEDWGGDYDKIREELMNRGPAWADSLPGIARSLNWMSENTFGAAKQIREGVDVLAGFYRAFLDALPYRRQDGRAARALPRGRAADAYERWRAFKANGAGADGGLDDAPEVGGRDAVLAGEKEVEAYWTEVGEAAASARGPRRKAPGASVGVVTDGGGARLAYLADAEGGKRDALVADTMALVLSLRRAAAEDARASNPSASRTSSSGKENSAAWNPSDVDEAADAAGDRRDALLSGWGGGGNSAAFSGGYGRITAAEAAEAREAAACSPAEVAARVHALSALLLCTPGEAIAAAHRFPAILETPRSVIAARMAALKELLPGADAAVIFRAEPRALLAGDGEEIMAGVAANVGTIRRELPGINADKLVEIEPNLAFTDIRVGLEGLRELWPEEAFRRSEADNPFFAEELALAIKALNGKGEEKMRK